MSMGGMGLRGAEEHGPILYSSSIMSSLKLSRTLQGIEDKDTPLSQEVLQAVSACVGKEVTVESLEGLPQKALSLMVHQNSFSLLEAKVEEQGVVREVARLASLGLPRAEHPPNTSTGTAPASNGVHHVC